MSFKHILLATRDENLAGPFHTGELDQSEIENVTQTKTSVFNSPNTKTQKVLNVKWNQQP